MIQSEARLPHGNLNPLYGIPVGGHELSSGTHPGGKTHLGLESIGGHGHSEGLECVCVFGD